MLRYTFLLLLITLQFSIQKALDSRGGGGGGGNGEGKWVSITHSNLTPCTQTTEKLCGWLRSHFKGLSVDFLVGIGFTGVTWDVLANHRSYQSKTKSTRDKLLRNKCGRNGLEGSCSRRPFVSPWSLSHTSLPDVPLSGSLSNDVFEPRTSTGSGVTLTKFSGKSSPWEKRH